MAEEFPHRHEPPPEAERTIVRPRPGARPAAPPTAWSSVPAAPAESVQPLRSPTMARNPLLACAQPLLSLIAPMRSEAAQADPNALRETLSAGIEAFEHEAHRAGIARETIVAARYLLCTFLDETAAATPWGSGGAWASDTLLVRFHNETWGGEKVFALLARLAQDPARNHDLLELAYYCLALGFQGRYGAMKDGRAQLGRIAERLHEMLRASGAEPERSLSPQWSPAIVRKRHWLGEAPFWAFCSVTGLVALGVYFGYAMLLGSRSDPVFAAVQAIRLPNVAAPQPAAPAAQRRLAAFLEDDIRAGRVSVRDEATQSVVAILGDGFFEPGSAVVPASRRALVERIAKALAANPGRILVSGHTDNVPIRTARFPSNWDLSQARAQAVKSILAESIGGSRVEAEGRADSEPIASNDTPAGRARNRRVEVTLFASAR